jgi:hypothetical protein
MKPYDVEFIGVASALSELLNVHGGALPPEHVLLNFPRCRLGKLANEAISARNLEVGEMSAGELPQILSGRRYIVAQHHERMRRFPPFLIAHPDYRHLEYRGMS